jgi:hypothetical protein
MCRFVLEPKTSDTMGRKCDNLADADGTLAVHDKRLASLPILNHSHPLLSTASADKPGLMGDETGGWRRLLRGWRRLLLFGATTQDER